jgi:NAD dependent epimerase/dehydratase family enzyme
VLRIIRFLREHPELEGVVNASSPNPSDNATVMRSIRRVLGIPFGIPLPRFALEIGSAAIRTETELVLKSRWVVPERLTAAGFVFTHPELEPALRDILRS